VRGSSWGFQTSRALRRTPPSVSGRSASGDVYGGGQFAAVFRGDAEADGEGLLHGDGLARGFVAQRVDLGAVAGPEEVDVASVHDLEGLDVELAGVGGYRLDGAVDDRPRGFYHL